MSPDLLNQIEIHLSNEIGQVVLYAVFATCIGIHCAVVKYLFRKSTSW